MVHVSSSSSEEHNYYSGDEIDFGDEPALPDTSKFSHISEEEMQAYVPAMVSPSGEVTGVEAATSSHIEDMIQELVQPEGLEVPTTGMLLEGD